MTAFCRVLFVSCTLLMLSSCAVKTGQYSFREPFDEELEEPFHYWDLEFSTPRWFLNDHVDLAFNLGYGNGSDSGTLDTTHGEVHAQSAKLLEFRAAARWFPLGGDKAVVPYLGAGYGWYKYEMETKSQGDYAYSDYLYDYYEIDEDETTLSSSGFPFITGGVYVPFGEKKENAKLRPALQLEYRRDFEKSDQGFDLSGYQASVGLAFMW